MPDAAAPLAAGALTGPSGAPVLVLGNSLGTSAEVWERQVPALRDSFRLLRYELPGHGGSAAPAGPYTIAQLGQRVLALLDDREVGRAAYWGISLGAMIGMWLGEHAPERISSLGLVCTSAYLPPAEGWLTRAAQVRSTGLASISGGVVARWFTPAYAASEPAVVDQFRAGLERTAAEGYAGCCEAIAAMDLRPDLAAIRAPTLVIVGEEDPATPLEHGALIAEHVPGARLEIIPGAAHLAAVSAAPDVTRLLLRHAQSAV